MVFRRKVVMAAILLPQEAFSKDAVSSHDPRGALPPPKITYAQVRWGHLIALVANQLFDLKHIKPTHDFELHYVVVSVRPESQSVAHTQHVVLKHMYVSSDKRRV